MKKWMVIIFGFLINTDLFSMAPLRSRLGTTNTLLRQLRTVKPKDINQVAIQARQLHDVRDLAGTFRNLPQNTRNLSPLLGAINADNYYIEKYKNENPNPETAAIKNALHLLDDKLRPTQAPGNPFYSLNGDLLAQIAMIVADQNFELETLLNDPLLQLWHQKHFELTNRYEKFKDFKYQVKKHLKPFEQLSPQERTDIFATFSFLKHTTREDIEPYIQKLGDANFDAYKKRYYSDSSKRTLRNSSTKISPLNFEQLTIDLLDKDPIEYLKVPFEYAEYKNQSVPPCTEVALRSVINYILWDPVTKKLNPQLLPQSIQLNPEFENFIKNYSEPQSNNYYAKSRNDWLELVSNIPGINYLRWKTEMAGEKENSLAALNYLFGTQAHTMQEFSQLISTPKRPISFTTETGSYGTCEISTPTGDGSWKFNKGHVSFATPIQENNELIQYYPHEIAKAGKQFDTNLVTLIPNRQKILKEILLYQLKKPSIEDIIELFSQFKLPLNTEFENYGNLINYAVEKNNFKLTEFALSQNIPIKSQPSLRKKSPLEKALYNNNVKIAQLLIDHGADINEKNYSSYNLLQSLLITDDLTPEIIKLFVKNGFDINQKDEYGTTILNRAVESSKARPKIIETLLNAGADPEAKSSIYGTPLKKARENGDPEIIQLIEEAIKKRQEIRNKKIKNFLNSPLNYFKSWLF